MASYIRISRLLVLVSIFIVVFPSIVRPQTQKINGSLNIIGSVNWCLDTGVVNAYACSWPNAPASYRTGTVYSFQAKTTNTGAASFNVNGLGPKAIKKMVGGITTDLVAGDIRVDQQVDTKYDGTNLQMLSQPGTITNPAGMTSTIASGSIALATASIPSGTCATAQTATATGTVTTDAIIASFNGDITGVTGYTPATTGTLRVDVYPSANAVNIRVCNATANPITPGATTLNFRVVR